MEKRERKGGAAMFDMAVFKARYIPKQTDVRAAAKDHIRYIQNRPGLNGAKIQRTLFGIDGKMERGEAYRMLDEAKGREYVYKIILNFDPVKEDPHKDLYTPDIARHTMLGVEDVVRQPVQWVAAVHDDHTPLQHVHIVAILPRKLNVPDLTAMIDRTTAIALEQRREKDKVLESEQNKERGKDTQWERQR